MLREDNWIMINAQVIASLPSFDCWLIFYTAWMRKASLSFDPNGRQTVAGTDFRPRICETTLNPVVL